MTTTFGLARVAVASAWLAAMVAFGVAEAKTGPVLTTPTEVTVGGVPYFNDALFLVAEEFGWAKEVGLKLRHHVLGAYPEVHQTLAGGSIDVAASIPQAFVPASGTLNNVVFVFANDMWWGSGVLVRPGKFKTYQQFLKELGKPDEALKATVHQLKGKKLIGNFAGGPGIYIPKLLEVAGLSTQDVQMLNLPPGQGPAAFIRGEGDTFSGTLPDRVRLQEEGAEVLVDARDMPFVESWLYDAWIARRDWVAKNEDTMMRLLGAWFRVSDALRTPERDKALEVMRRWVNKETGANFTIEQARWVFDQVSPEPTLEEISQMFYDPKSQFNFEQELRRRIEFFTARGRLQPGAVSVESISLARQLHEKYMGYKAETDKALGDLKRRGALKPEVKDLVEWAEWHYTRRNYVDSAALARKALKAPR